MARLEEVDKSTLKVGDTVGILYSSLGWTRFRYEKIQLMTIERITPARTKFIMTNGRTFSKDTVFYKNTDEAKRRNFVVECAESIDKCMDKIEKCYGKGKLLRKSDKKIIKISEILKELCKEIEEK